MTPEQIDQGRDEWLVILLLAWWRRQHPKLWGPSELAVIQLAGPPGDRCIAALHRLRSAGLVEFRYDQRNPTIRRWRAT